MVLDLAKEVTVVRAVDAYWVTLWRMLVVEMLRVTEFLVRVLSSWSGGGWEKRKGCGVVGVVIGELVMVSAAGPDAEHWPVIVQDAFVSQFYSDVVVVRPRGVGGRGVDRPGA